MAEVKRSTLDRQLDIYTALLNGEKLTLEEYAEKFGVSEKSISRDFEKIQMFLSDYNAEKGSSFEITNTEVSRRDKGQYQLQNADNRFMTRSQILAVSKILMDSRGLCEEEMSPIMEKLISSSVSVDNQRFVKELLLNEWFNYVEPSHKKPVLEKLLDISKAVKAQKVIEIQYAKSGGDVVKRTLEPLGIIFSEYYFYLAGNLRDFDKEKHFQVKGDENPTMYRVDRIQELVTLNEAFGVSESKRFKEGEYRKRIQFMYGGELHHLKLLVRAFALEPVCDKLATAKVTPWDKDGFEFLVEAELFGDGILMWLMGQGGGVKLIAPDRLVEKMKDRIAKISGSYGI